MNNLRAYLWWIILGSVLLIELGTATWIWLDEEPETSKAKIDRQFSVLENLNGRAKAEVHGLYDPENRKDIDSLTQEYLLNAKWKKALEPALNDYNKQIKDIYKELAARSELLHKPVFDSEDTFRWDVAYEEQSVAVLRRLIAAKGIVIPSGTKVELLQSNRAIRDMIGLYTKEGTTTATTMHSLYSTRLRIIESLADIVEKTRVDVRANPVVATTPLSIPPSEAVGAAIEAVEWSEENSGSTKKLTGTLAESATAIPVRVTFQGSTSALMAVQARVEALGKPVVCVVGTELKNRGDWKPLERKDKPYEPMVLKLDVLVLDFTKAQALAADDEGSPGKLQDKLEGESK